MMRRATSHSRLPTQYGGALPRVRQKAGKLHLSFRYLLLVPLLVLALWVLWVPLRLDHLAFSSTEANLLERGLDTGVVGGQQQQQQQQLHGEGDNGISSGGSGGGRSDVKKMSDLDVVKRTKAEQEATRAAIDARDRPVFDRSYCEEHFGMPWVQAWNATAVTVCSPHQYHRRDLPNCVIRCRSQVDVHMPNASAPHVMCDARNLTIDSNRMYRAHCPKHRPNYMCTRISYNRYKSSAFSAVCDWPMFALSEFPVDHLRDIFDSLRMYGESDNPPQPAELDPVRTLLVTRESLEYYNVFHTFTDLLNAYITTVMLGWDGSPRQVVLLDNHRQGPLDGLWAALAAGGGPAALKEPWKAVGEGGQRLLRRATELKSPTLMRHVVFVPPGYSSLLFAFLHSDNECPARTSLFRGFRTWVLAGLGLSPGPHAEIDPAAPLKVLLVSRKPYKGHTKVSRQIGNEGDLVAGLRALPGAQVTALDLSALPAEQQIEVISQTDVLIGMHGAALVYSTLQPPYGALVELWPTADGIWRCYEHTAEWSGLLYRRWANSEPSRVRKTRAGDVTQVAVDAIADMVSDLLPRVQRRKASYAKNGDMDSSQQPFLVKR